MMMKPKFLFVAVAFLLAFTACNKVTDSIRRDVIITPTPLRLNIPLANTIVPITIDSFPLLVNLSDQIAKQTNNEFTLADVTSIRLSSFTIELPKDSIANPANSLGNIETIKVLITSGSQKDSLAKASNFSDVALRSMSLATLIQPDTLKSYLSKPNLKYNIQIRARRPITAIIPTVITPVYILSMKK